MTLHEVFGIFFIIDLFLAAYCGLLTAFCMKGFYKRVEVKMGLLEFWMSFCTGYIAGLIPFQNIYLIWNYVFRMNEILDSAIDIHNKKNENK